MATNCTYHTKIDGTVLPLQKGKKNKSAQQECMGPECPAYYDDTGLEEGDIQDN